jgi:hypothetical protein
MLKQILNKNYFTLIPTSIILGTFCMGGACGEIIAMLHKGNTEKHVVNKISQIHDSKPNTYKLQSDLIYQRMLNNYAKKRIVLLTKNNGILTVNEEIIFLKKQNEELKYINKMVVDSVFELSKRMDIIEK